MRLSLLRWGRRKAKMLGVVGSGRCGDSSRILESRADKCCQPLSALLESAVLRYLSFVTISSLRYVKQFSLSPELFIRVYKTVVYFVMFFGKPLGVSNQVKTQFSQSWYVILLYKYWDLLTKWQWWKNRSVFSHSQSARRTVNFL